MSKSNKQCKFWGFPYFKLATLGLSLKIKFLATPPKNLLFDEKIQGIFIATRDSKRFFLKMSVNYI